MLKTSCNEAVGPTVAYFYRFCFWFQGLTFDVGGRTPVLVKNSGEFTRTFSKEVKNRMILEKRKIGLAFVFMFSMIALLPILTTSTVFATPPTTVAATVILGPTPIEQKMAGGNTILVVTFADTYTGSFAGSASGIASVVIHQGNLNVHHIDTFTGTVDGKSGTMVISFKGQGEGVGLPLKGNWVILSGTGDLAAIHGEGTFEGIAGVAITLTGNIHFDP
jgi:hypothetical protein